MPRKLFKCTKCGRYTLRRDNCPYCGEKVKSAHPPRWSPYDRLSKYRVLFKAEMYARKGVRSGSG